MANVSITVTLRDEIWASNDGPVEGRFCYLGSDPKGNARWGYQKLTSAGYASGKPPKRLARAAASSLPPADSPHKSIRTSAPSSTARGGTV